MGIDDDLEGAWDHVQRRLYCYELPYPRIVEQSRAGTAFIDMSSHQININRQFLNYLWSRGVGAQKALKGLLFHEAGHFKIIPWDLKNLMLMYHTACKACGSSYPDATNYFSDIVLNLHIIKELKQSEIVDVYRCLDKESALDNLICNLYESKTGIDFGSRPLEPELHPVLARLERIDYSRRHLHRNLKSFCEAVKDLLTSQPQGGHPLTMLDSFGLGAYSEEDKNRALKELARELDDVESFESIYRIVKRKKPRKGDGVLVIARHGGGRDSGTDLDALIEFYTAKADSYRISIGPKDSFASRESERGELKPWSEDEPYLAVDVFNSYGRFIPEITKSWTSRSEDGRIAHSKTPGLVILLDSSASMADPSSGQSKAVIGALCAARQYLSLDRKVGVVNFSNTTRIRLPDQDYASIAKSILHYQGGGTVLNASKVVSMVKQEGSDLDVMLISDGCISNASEAVSSLSSLTNTNRITYLEIDNPLALQVLDVGPKVRYFKVNSADDLPRVVVGELRGVE